ncbi:hypothetical protein [Alteribacillus sp. YIM 98480]|uniref:hypothetical protein n=1 Tax=Alteribacillus sp. YIM 98480 TaxID=2606599 RepID=UPI00131D62A9|nr:hypothetical protein [Alteribacillus sp. YIM 98480]
MKKYLLFIVSFGILYIVFEIMSGMMLTSMYLSDFSYREANLNQKVSFGTHSYPFLMGLLAATLAFFIAQKSFNEK